MDRDIEDLIEEFYALKHEQRARRAAHVGPDRTFYILPTEQAARARMDELREQIKSLARD